MDQLGMERGLGGEATEKEQALRRTQNRIEGLGLY
jgi:hypothetical protein